MGFSYETVGIPWGYHQVFHHNWLPGRSSMKRTSPDFAEVLWAQKWRLGRSLTGSGSAPTGALRKAVPGGLSGKKWESLYGHMALHMLLYGVHIWF